MRFWITSDLHYGRTRGDRATERLAAHIRAHPADAVVLGGDLGNGRDAIAACLALFADLPGPKLLVPGNHDVWTPGWDTDDSWCIHEEALPALAREAGFHSLHLAPLQVGDVAFVGSMGWYNYSFQDDLDVDITSYETKVPPWANRAIWMDAHHAHFDVDDRALTERLAARLSAHLAQVEAQQVVAIVHHLVDKALLVHPRAIVPFKWRWANAFLGANVFGERLGADGRVGSVFCGHIHMERRATVSGIPARCIGSDYNRKQLLLSDGARVLETHNF